MRVVGDTVHADVVRERSSTLAGSEGTCRCLIFSVCEITERHKLPIGQVVDKWSRGNRHTRLLRALSTRASLTAAPIEIVSSLILRCALVLFN